MRKNIEANYSGFFDKVNNRTQYLYKALVDSLSKEAAKAEQDIDCFRVASTYVDFFKDKHAVLNYYDDRPSTLSIEQIRSYFRPVEQIKMDTAAVLNYLTKNKHKLDPIEGIYISDSRVFTVAIIKRPKRENEFAGIVLNSTNSFWYPGDVRMEIKRLPTKKYQIVLYGGAHNPLTPSVKLTGDVLEIGGRGGEWYRLAVSENTTGSPYIHPPKRKVVTDNFSELSFKKLSDRTNVLRIPSFNGRYKSKLDSTVGANWPLISTTPNLIIDIRSNGGGQDFVYDTLVGLAYTNEIVKYNIEVRASEENIHLFESKGLKDYAEKLRTSTKDSNGFISRSIRNTVKDSVYPYPKQIVVLVDKRVGSTAEQFVLTMKQSGKVMVVGENTTGGLDYAELLSVAVPCTKWELSRAVSKHGRLPEYTVDQNGITPDIYVPDYEEDWVDFSRRLMEKMNAR